MEKQNVEFNWIRNAEEEILIYFDVTWNLLTNF